MLRRDELCQLTVRVFRRAPKGLPHLRRSDKGAKTRYLRLHPGAHALILKYLDAAGLGVDDVGALLRPVRNNRTGQLDHAITPDGLYRLVWAYSAELELDFEFGTHALRATAATNTLDHQAHIVEVQGWHGHANIAATRIHDHRRSRPEDSPTFKVAYRGGEMIPVQKRQRVIQFLKAALECSIYHAPTEPGLTYDELSEVGRRIGFQSGEISDGMSQVADMSFGQPDTRLQLRPADTSLLMNFNLTRHGNPDYRNPQAFNFVFDQLRDLARANGARHAKIERHVLAERGVTAGLPRRDVEVAITILCQGGVLKEEQTIIGFAPGRENYAAPSEQIPQTIARPPIRNEARAQAYPIVQDVISRRHDGRPRHAEPLDAFAEALVRLGYGDFRLWWSQIVAEFRQASPQTMPTSAIVQAGAIVEGVLTFVVKHARSLNLGVMGSKTFDGKPSSWRIDDLVTSAAAGRDSAILDLSMRHRANVLIRARQRIHAGRMLSDFPAGPPDLRPEEARDAKITAEQVVRCVLDWLQRHPVA